MDAKSNKWTLTALAAALIAVLLATGCGPATGIQIPSGAPNPVTIGPPRGHTFPPTVTTTPPTVAPTP
jgi:hypothetical protein